MRQKLTRVVIVDDQRMFAESIKYIIESRASDIEVVGIALDGKDAVRIVAKAHPHIVFMDVRMPVMDGVEATKIIHRQYPDVRIVMLSTFDDDEYVLDSLKYGAVGYLLKNMPPVELINAIRAVRGGIMSIDPAVASSLIRDAQTDAPDEQILKNLGSLTKREVEVLELMVRAHDNGQIARNLSVTEHTARNYISTIYDKLGVGNRMDVLKIVDKITWYLDHRESR